MAGYKTHITTSTVLGVGYGAGAYLLFGVPAPTCLLAGGLCSVSGMLPDLDSQSGTPVREGSALAAAVVPMLMIDRFHHMGWTNEMIAVVGGIIYLAIRWTLPYLLGKFSKHRGMWHSFPACAIAGTLAFILCSGATVDIRLFKAGGVVLGFMSHLVLDEIWAMDFSKGGIKFKSSFGTAMKFYSKSTWANISTYGKLAAVIVLACGDPFMMDTYNVYPNRDVNQTARKIQQSVDNLMR